MSFFLLGIKDKPLHSKGCLGRNAKDFANLQAFSSELYFRSSDIYDLI